MDLNSIVLQFRLFDPEYLVKSTINETVLIYEKLTIVNIQLIVTL